MKVLISKCGFLLIFLVMSLFVSAQDDQEKGKVNYFDPETWFLGDFDVKEFLREPHNIWYAKEFDNYVFDDEAFAELAELSAEKLSIVIVLGTWCPDSRREVPRFMKLMESWGFPGEKIRFIGTDSYKLAPLDDYDSFDIERVPTFIIYSNKVELGRIIEYPEASLERDMINILRKEKLK